MASCTPRIILTLAVPLFGFLTILFLKRKKLKSSGLINLTDTTSPSSDDLTNSMKLQPDYSTVVQSAKTEKMQLKEKESSPTTMCNGVASLPKQICEGNGISTTSNGISSNSKGASSTANEVTQQNQINGQCRASYAAALKINKNVNGTSSNAKTKSKENGTVQPAKVDKNCSQNELKTQAAGTEQNGKLSSNGASEGTLNPAVNEPNGVPIVTSSNGVNQSSKSKSKKKSKSKMPEKTNTCSTKLTSNGCGKDNTVLVNTDKENTLSNGFSNLTLDTTSVQEIVHGTKSQEMNLNSCPINSTTDHTSSANSSVTQTIATDNVLQDSHNDNVVLIAKDLTDKVAKECDIVDQAILPGSPCVTPESGRSSESETPETLQVDVNGHLTFPEDCVAVGGQDMLPSPEAAYCDSLGSNDSGRGGSELQFGFDSQPCSMTYEFDLHADHCGYLIGKRGSHVNYIKEKTGALIWIRNSLSPFNNDKKVVSIISSDEASINEALKLIRKRFPLSQYPDVSLDRSNCVLVCPPTLKLTLPEGVEFQVVLSATVNAAHFFVQLPTHPSYHALPPFTMSMASLYTHCHAPIVTTPTIGNIVVAPVADGWFRAEIMEVFPEDNTCKLKYLDYGGFQILPTTALRQINFEFMQMPFQAIECYLANVTCHEELGWTDESKIAFENLAQGQILSAYIAGIAEDGVPCLHLYKVTGATNTFINQALVESGYAKWVNYEQ